MTYALSISENPSPRTLPIPAAAAIVTAVHVTTGCIHLEIFRGTRVPAVKLKSVVKSSDSCATGLASPPVAAGETTEALTTASAPERVAPIPNRWMSDALNAGVATSTGFCAVVAATVVKVACVAGTGDERELTTVAVEARLTNHPPKMMSRSLMSFVMDGAGDRGRTTKLGAKNTGSHLFSIKLEGVSQFGLTGGYAPVRKR